MSSDQRQPEPASAPAAKPRPKVLFLWYDDGLPRLLARNVKDEFEVIAVHSRAAALEALATTSFCAILFNIISLMRDVPPTFAEELERLGYHVPVIIVTAAVSSKEVGSIWWDPPHPPWPGNILAVVPLPATLEIMLTVLRAALARSVQRVPDTAVPPPLPNPFSQSSSDGACRG